MGDMCGFDQVIRHLKNGGKAKRDAWAKMYNSAKYITMGYMDEPDRLVVILVSSRGSKLVWMASPIDMITDDWILLE